MNPEPGILVALRDLRARLILAVALSVPLILISIVPPLKFEGRGWVAWALATPAERHKTETKTINLFIIELPFRKWQQVGPETDQQVFLVALGDGDIISNHPQLCQTKSAAKKRKTMVYIAVLPSGALWKNHERPSSRGRAV